MNKKHLVLLLSLILVFTLVSSDVLAKKKKKKMDYRFQTVKEVTHTPVKSQGRTGTCWSFATVSFLESEFIRKTGITDIDLSEMYIVRHVYPRKAQNYVRLHGVGNFGSGGQGHDVLDQMKLTGIVPESVYSGKKIGEKRHNHGELGTVLGAFIKGIVKNRGSRLSPRWMEAFNAILDVYLGKDIKEFTYKGKTYTPKSFVSDYLKIDPNDYVELTSSTHIPFFSTFQQMLPDNWSFSKDYINIPIDLMEQIVDDAIMKGHSIGWDADVSDRYFSIKQNKKKMNIAVVPLKDYGDMTKKEKKTDLKIPVKEKVITQEMRQKDYDNYTTTDDHLMHLVGIVKDQWGNRFYKIKNSWGTDYKHKGYFYISKAFFRLRTINILVNKAVLPDDLKQKVGLK